MTTTPSPIYVLITGVSPGGLGDALTAELLKQPNIHILASGLETNHLSHLPNSNRISKLQLDVTSPNSISAAVTTVSNITSGRLKYLINNAGYGYMMPLLDAEAQAVKKNFEVNVFGLLAVTQAFFPLLREAKGTVVNQCSIASVAAGRQPYLGSYCASKAAVASLNDTMRVEFAPFGVKVVCLVTGAGQTGFWAHASAAASGLPASSLYGPISAHVQQMMSGETNPPGLHSRERWAAAVVRDLLQPRPNRFIRHGFLAWQLVVASLLMPVWLLDWLFTKTAKLAELKSILAASEAKKEQ